MSYVKSISIKTTVNKSIAYILNPDKTESLLFASGINCVADKDIAYGQFCGVYKQFNDRLYTGVKGRKSPIKAHHFIQSFKEGQVTPELAHKIGKEWAEKVFGDNRQVIISTHTDKGHIHNHVIINSLDLDGKKYYGNKTTLKRARAIDNEICIKYGIPIIEKNMKKAVHYKEWMEKQKGNSWKNKLKLFIDKEVMKVNNLDELITSLKNNGYEVKKGKYISVKPLNIENAHAVRTFRLGEDYSEVNLIKRIKEKDKELPILDEFNRSENLRKQTQSNNENKPKYQGIQLKYVSLIKIVADLIVNGKKPSRKYNPKKPYSKENDYDVNLLAMQLRLLNKENITTENELLLKYEEVNKTFNETKATINKLSSLCESLNGVISNVETYFQLKNKANLFPSENLKLTIAKSVIQKYNISNESDLNKLRSEYIKADKKQKELKQSFESLEKRFKEFNELVKTHESIKNDSYLKIIQSPNKQLRKNDEI